ncbi:MAG: PKD domain-containing protein [bacterium]
MKRTPVAFLIGVAIGFVNVPVQADVSGEGAFCNLQPGICGGLKRHDDTSNDVGGRVQPLSRFYWRIYEYSGSQFCTGADGRQEYMRLIDRLTSQVIDSRFRCPDPTTRRLSLPPVPPSPSAVWDKVPLPQPEVRVNPGVGGLAGLETYLWYNQPTTASLQLDLDGFNTTIDARVVRLRWYTGDGRQLTSTVPGSATEPAVRHVYEAKGTYIVRLEVTWSGTYRFAGPGLDPLMVPLGERTFSGEASYSVAEIRGVRQ